MTGPFSITRNFYWWKLRRNISRSLESVDGTRGLVVDIGCGEGECALLLQDRLRNGWRYLGIDLDVRCLERTRIVLEQEGLAGDVVRANSVTTLPLSDRSVDLVTCSEVIEHIPEPLDLLSQVARVLKPGGSGVFTTPNPRQWIGAAPDMASIERENASNCSYGHVSVLAQSTWKDLFRKSGLHLEQVARGAMVYGKPEYEKSQVLVGAYVLLDGLLDLLPGAPLTENICYTVRKR